MKRRELTIPTLLGVLLSLVGLGAGLWFLREPIKTAVFASANETPTQILVTNTSDTSFAVSWTTPKSTSGYLQYGESTSPNLVVSDDRDQEGGTVTSYLIHFVTVRGLKPSTTYNFRVGSGSKLYDQQGQPYQVRTGLSLGTPPAADVAYGQVLTPSGDPADGAVVYLSLPGAVLQAGLVKSSGAWVIPLSTARSADLTNFAAYDPQTTQEQLQVQDGSLGSATMTVTTGQDSPVPTITLGQTYNPVSPAPNQTSSGEATPSGTSSRLSTQALGPASETTSGLILVSPQTNEQVNSTKPQIIGRGPANTKITITVNSPAAITAVVTTNSQGGFSYTIPQNLTPGEHTMTLSAVINGVTQTITRHFVVLAAAGDTTPAFSATPSATIRPSPTPTLAPRVTIPATGSGVPTSGNLTPTLVLLILGSGLILSGLVVYRKLA